MDNKKKLLQMMNALVDEAEDQTRSVYVIAETLAEDGDAAMLVAANDKQMANPHLAVILHTLMGMEEPRASIIINRLATEFCEAVEFLEMEDKATHVAPRTVQ